MKFARVRFRHLAAGKRGKLHMEVTFCKAFALARAKGAETPNALSLDADRSRTLLPRECRYIVTWNAPERGYARESSWGGRGRKNPLAISSQRRRLFSLDWFQDVPPSPQGAEKGSL
jgi:hypothetical protein